jgi:xanthine/CO dehydrogenase XdhC/CoxF family maturation factor
MLNHAQQVVLRALFELATENRAADLVTLGSVTGLGTRKAGALLVVLERAGLVGAGRPRLTMSGLALAVISPALERRQAIAA